MSLPLIQESPPLTADADGVVRVGGTRVTLDVIVEAFGEGLTAEEIQQQYPALGLEHVYAAIGYYLRHQDEVARYLDERRRQEHEARSRIDARTPRDDFRQRLLARRRS